MLQGGGNFFNDVLEHLFYEGFSEESSDDHYSKFKYRIPFLNGGLFEAINDYNWRDTDIFLDNEIFEEIINTFDEFNFTVKEDEPLEKEVAVDPEMLGKVFENLLEIVDRKSKGAFYTPRHIVHYMCQESLISYLKTNSAIPEEDLRIFITKGESAINSIIRANEEKKKYNGKQYTRIELPDSIRENSETLEILLQKVKVVDPAVGSGAFPVGMMKEIVKARYILYLLAEIEDINLYDLKQETIENSLYGVDIELSATDVTKLRFWLSLIVDEDNMDEIKPLPNLDNQIMCGNSLVDSYKGIRLFDETLIQRSGQQKLMITPVERAFNNLENKKIEYFKTSGPKTKIKLKKEINNLKWNFIEKQIENYNPKLIENIRNYKDNPQNKPFFVWELEFSEIFKGDKPGFDIVIGNPPYIGKKGNKDAFDLVNETDLGKRFASGQMDYFYYFFHKGLDICKSDGVLSFITTNYFITADSALKLRNDIKNRTTIKQLINFNELKIFKSAMGQHNIITILEKNQNENFNSYNSITHRKGLFTDKILTNIFNRTDKNTDFFIISQKDIYDGDENYIRITGISGAKTGNEKNDKILTILNKIQDNGTKMSNICDVKTGLRSGIDKISNRHLKIDDSFTKGDEVFIVSEQFYNNAPKEDKKYIKPFIKNSNIKRYLITKTNKYIIYTNKKTNIEDLNYIKNHLLKYKSLIEIIRKKDGTIWYSLDRPREKRIFTSPKIIIPQRSEFNNFSYTEDDLYGSADIYYIINKKGFGHINLKYVLALINSKLYYVWLYYKGKRKGDNLELYNTPLSNIYIPELSVDDQLVFIKFTDELLELYSDYNLNKDESIKEKIDLIENELNQTIYILFELTNDEIELVEYIFNKRYNDGNNKNV